MSEQIQHRSDTAANWTSVNPTLAQGEIGYETDTRLLKMGDGSTAWTSLSYWRGKGGEVTIATTGGTTVLTSLQGLASVVKVTGNLTTPVIIEVPAKMDMFVADNATNGAQTVSFKVSGQVTPLIVGVGHSPCYTDSTEGVESLASTGAGSGDVVGPASAVSGNVVKFSGTTGKQILDSGLTLSGTNTGDQTSIVGITGTKAQFNTAVSDGDIVFLDSADTITGVKTFNDTKLALRNVADTFSGLFTNTITAARTWTLPDISSTLAVLGLAQTWTKTQSPAATTLTSTAGSVAIDASLSNYFTHTLTENTTLAAPSNAVAGTTFTIVFTQHASAAKTLAFNAAWKPASGTAGVLSTTLSATNVMTCVVESASIITYGFATKGIA